MFLNIEKYEKKSLAIKDDSGWTLTYGDVCDSIEQFSALKLPRSIIFCLCENCAGALVGYMAFESNKQIPLLLDANLDKELRVNLDIVYSPSYYWVPLRMEKEIGGEKIYEKFGYVLLRTIHKPYFVNDKLSLLITTSGSTGSPKLVRHKYGNLEANAINVAKVFGWKKEDRGICDLPMNYAMGLNVINSHIAVGASVLMIKANLMEAKFWEFIKVNKGTNICGVPFSYEIMRKIGFDNMELPDLHTLSEGGGKLTDRMFKWLVDYCQKSGKRFCATFGTSETSARMTFLKPELAINKIGSIGQAIPEGELFLINEKPTHDGKICGELGYRGPNVTMGYATCKEDLMREDEFHGEYHTGDIAKRDEDGYYYIIGRKKRFLKIFGSRISLDETENLLRQKFNQDFVCMGNDKQMCIFTLDSKLEFTVKEFISKKTGMHISAFKTIIVDEIPRNEYGKIKYDELEKIFYSN